CVLELGQGVGAMTSELCMISKRVAAIELDERLFPLLSETLGEYDNFTLVKGDILKTDIRAVCASFDGSRAVACANLPYYITTPAITALINSGCFESITVMVQKEVADRICASPGKKDYGAFTLFVKYYSEPVFIGDVSRDCFIPSPNVDSAVVRLDMLKKPRVACDEKLFFKTVKCAFAQRRKTLLNCISGQFGLDKSAVSTLLTNAGIDANARGETLSINDFAKVTDKLGELL
ncbi:MAG: ribosomal RNA small subunit methyltransferase A, partial [Clostridia bacterium]|nr:ribosomal RNA small subunit methyltransferase A [Clostridia bacterium]